MRAHHASHLVGGRVWLLGGEGASDEDTSPRPLSTVLEFDPALDRFTSATALLEARSLAASVGAADGSILLFGGQSAGGALTASAEAYVPGAGPRRIASLDAGCELHTATLLADGRILVIGGELSDGDYRSSVLRYE